MASFIVRSVAKPVSADANNPRTVTNNGYNTVYYGDADVDNGDTAVTIGNSVTLTGTKYFVSAGTSNLSVLEPDTVDAGEIAASAVTTAKIADSAVTAAKLGLTKTTYTQTYSTASATVPNATASSVATTGASNSSPYGYTGAAQADAIVTALNATIVDVANVKKVVTQIIDDLQLNNAAG